MASGQMDGRTWVIVRLAESDCASCAAYSMPLLPASLKSVGQRMDFIKSYLKTENGYCVERSLFCTKLARNSEQAADESHK